MATEGPLEMAAVASAPTTMTNSSGHFSSSQVLFLFSPILVSLGLYEVGFLVRIAAGLITNEFFVGFLGFFIALHLFGAG